MLKNEEMFLANYSDGLSDVDLPAMIDAFKQSGKIACFVAARPNFSLHLVEMDAEGKVGGLRATRDANLWINGGGFIFRREIFDYLRDGEELVEEPFQRLIKDDQLMAFRHEGFWRPMDTLKDKEVLEDLVEQGRMPWRIGGAVSDFPSGVTGRSIKSVGREPFNQPQAISAARAPIGVRVQSLHTTRNQSRTRSVNLRRRGVNSDARIGYRTSWLYRNRDGTHAAEGGTPRYRLRQQSL